jgi:glutathione synthase/RimK-type ligase-like ATP-grasp enzyme
MLLILTNTDDVTADYLESVLTKHKIRLVRLDTDTILQRTSFAFSGEHARIQVDGVSYSPEEFSNVWYRRPERLKSPQLNDSPEARVILDEWSEALEGFFAHIPERRWMNHPARNVGASHKLEQLTRAATVGLRVPNTIVTQNADDLRAFYAAHGERVIVKPMATGYVERPNDERDSLVYTNTVPRECLADLEDLSACPTLFQERIDKASDVRITVVDADMHAVELIAREPDGSQRCDIRRNNMDDVAYRSVTLPHAVEGRIRALATHYGLRFAAIDMAVTQQEEWVFFEINPNGQWAWLDLAGSTNIAASFVKSFGS